MQHFSPPPPASTFSAAPHLLRLLVVEDDFMQARTLRRYLTGLGYEVVGVAPTAAEGERLFDASAPDLLLLDVNLAGDGADGIELARSLLRRRPVPVIFLTSFQDAGTFQRARAVAPAAFLNKPFDEFVLGHAIELAAEQFVQQASAAAGALAAGIPLVPQMAEAGLVLRDAIWLREGTRLVRVPLAEVNWLEADSNHCHLHTGSGRKYTTRSNLGELLARLSATDFIRTHRSFGVRLASVESLELSCAEVHLRGGGTVPLGRAFRDEVLARLELLP